MPIFFKGIMKYDQVDKSYYICNPLDNSRKVYLFPDIPHCGKNFRSHVLDYGILVPSTDGLKTLDKEDFIDLLRYDKGEIKLCPKLTSLHVNCYGSMRQRVSLATQLLSNTVSKAIIHLDGDDAEFKSQYVSTFDSFFDTMNSNREYASQNLIFVTRSFISAKALICSSSYLPKPHRSGLSAYSRLLFIVSKYESNVPLLLFVKIIEKYKKGCNIKMV